jgi:tetratricopeptide (TPR) repeat protein
MKLLTVIALVALVKPASADPPALDPAQKAAAAQLVADGSARYNAKDFQAALDDYDRAYQIYPAAKLHYNRALALVGLRRQSEAADEFERFITEASDAPPAALAHASEALIALEKTLGRLAIMANVTGAVTIDGRAVGAAPVSVHLPPGPHEVGMTAAGRKPWRETLTIEATVTTRKLVELAPLDLHVPSPPPTSVGPPGPVAIDRDPEPRGEPGRSIFGRWWFWGAVGAAVVTGAALTYAATRPGAPATELGTIKPDL